MMKLRYMLNDFRTGWLFAFELAVLFKDSYQDNLPYACNTVTEKRRPATVFEISPGFKYIIPYKDYKEAGIDLWTLDAID